MTAPQTPKWTPADYDRAAEEYSLSLQNAPAHQDRIRELENQLREQDEKMACFVSAVRPLLEKWARLAGRQDILDQLPAATDTALLTRWLGELG